MKLEEMTKEDIALVLRKNKPDYFALISRGKQSAIDTLNAMAVNHVTYDEIMLAAQYCRLIYGDGASFFNPIKIFLQRNPQTLNGH